MSRFYVCKICTYCIILLHWYLLFHVTVTYWFNHSCSEWKLKKNHLNSNAGRLSELIRNDFKEVEIYIEESSMLEQKVILITELWCLFNINTLLSNHNRCNYHQSTVIHYLRIWSLHFSENYSEKSSRYYVFCNYYLWSFHHLALICSSVQVLQLHSYLKNLSYEMNYAIIFNVSTIPISLKIYLYKIIVIFIMVKINFPFTFFLC